MSNLPLTCPPLIKKASVKVLANVATLCEACSATNRIQGLFLALRGIELHMKASALGGSSEWVELFPDLEKRPRQVDLMGGDTDATASGLLGENAAIPAGIYDQVRLRLVPNQGDAETLTSPVNACGESGINCMIMADGHVNALKVAEEEAELRIASEALPGGLLLILPDVNEELHIQLTPVWAMVSSFPEGLRFVAALKANARIERVGTTSNQEN